MPDNQILNKIKNDPELAQQVMNHLLTERELFYETLDADNHSGKNYSQIYWNATVCLKQSLQKKQVQKMRGLPVM